MGRSAVKVQLTKAHDDGMLARMGMTVEGQVSIANPALGKRCAECASFAPDGKGKGACAKVKVMARKKGKPFDGKRAWACSSFAGRG